MVEQLVNKKSVITEGMTFGEALFSVLAHAGNSGINTPADLKLVTWYVAIGGASYEDLQKLNKIAQNFMSKSPNHDDEFSISVREGINYMNTFIDGVEMGKKLAAQQILDSLNK